MPLSWMFSKSSTQKQSRLFFFFLIWTSFGGGQKTKSKLPDLFPKDKEADFLLIKLAAAQPVCPASHLLSK